MNTIVLKGKLVHERYIVEELLGRGGFGAVYRVRDRRVKGNVFALKEVVDPNRHQQENFLFEGEILRRLDHPALPRVYRVFEDGKNNRAYMLMDYIEGPNLEELRLQQPEKRLSLPQSLKIMSPIMEAMSYLHAQQPPIIHRDVKPANVIVSPLEEGVLVDFGIAKEYDRDSTTAVVRHCSPGYGAPEQYVYGTSMQTDIYGLGATFYTLLTGEVPIDALYRITRISAKKADPLVPANALVPTIPGTISDVLERAMAVNSSDRFASVQEFWEALLVHVDEVQEPSPQNPVSSGSFSSTTTIAEMFDPSPAALAIVDMSSSSSGKVWKGPHPQRNVIGQKHLRSLIVGLAVLIFVALSSGVAMGSLGIWPGMKSARLLQGVTLTLPQSQPSILITQTSTPSIVNNYPSVAESYTGTIHSTLRNMDATLSLWHIRQDGSRISGYYTVEASSVDNGYYSMQSSFIDSGYFTGEMTINNKIRILIPSSNSSMPLFFKGYLHSDGSISGSYCSSWHHHCDYSGGEYGHWSVTPQVTDQ